MAENDGLPCSADHYRGTVLNRRRPAQSSVAQGLVGALTAGSKSTTQRGWLCENA